MSGKIMPENKFDKLIRDPKNIGRLCDLIGEMPNIKTPTMGGKYFWNTLAELSGYKLQKNKITNHCRIIDENNERIAWGSEEVLMKKINQVLGE